MATPRPRTNLLWHLLISLGLIGAMVPLAPSHAEAALPKPTLLGFASLDFRADLTAFNQQAGRSPALYQLYWGLDLDWPNVWAPGILSELEALGATAYIEVTHNDLDALNGGDLDNRLDGMAQVVGDWLKAGPNRHIVIAPLPEMNLTHPWGGDPAGFKAGYQRIRQAFIDQNLGPHQVRFIFAPNGVGGIGEYDDYYPGDAVVDLIGFSKINRGDPWRDYDVTFQMHIDELRSRISLTKPILISQSGSVSQNGNRSQWLSDMFTKLKAHDQVIGAVYFNRNKDGFDYRVLTGSGIDPSFRTGYQQWSDPGEVSWIFDGRMDAWVAEREQMFGSGFLDVHDHIFESSITWLADQKITQGCNPPLNTMFCPQDLVTRGQMAVFIARVLDLPAASDDYFADDKGHFYEEAANRLFEAKITVGCAHNRYCGDLPIPREQMAAFLARMLGFPGSSTDHFRDDDGTFERAINKLADAGVTAGCNPPANDRFCPKDLVTRGQMSAFIKRALGP